MKSSIQSTNINVPKTELKKQIKEQRWIDTIIERGGYCCLCGYNEDPTIIEEHHIGGKPNSKFTASVCPNCHRRLSNKQYGWDKAWTNKDNPPEKQLAFMLRGIADIQSLSGRLLKEASDSMLKRD